MSIHMTQKIVSISLLVSLAIASQALASELTVTFIEGAPKDRFVITNTANCDREDMRLTLDLAPSMAGLIFDTTVQGAGVDVFQPFALQTEATWVSLDSPVADGDQALNLTIERLEAGQGFTFTIDLDDTLTNSALGQIRVSGSEISGATVNVVTGADMFSAVFDETARAAILLPECAG